MAAGGPQAAEEEDQHGTHGVIDLKRMSDAVTTTQAGRIADAEGGESTAQDIGQQVKDPQTEGDFGLEEVEKTEDVEAEDDMQRSGVAHDRHCLVEQIDSASEMHAFREIGVQAVQRAPSGGEGETDPHPPIFKKRWPALRALSHRSHRQRHLHQRIDEALVVDPLPPQNDHDGDHHQEEGPDKGLPSHQRQQPSLPRHCVGGTHALKEELGVAELARHHPVGNVGVDEALPIVFGRGKVKGGR